MDDIPLEEWLSPPKFSEKKADTHHAEDFFNHPPRDFTLKKNRSFFTIHLKQWKEALPLRVPLIVNGEEIFHSQEEKRENPSDFRETVSYVSHASQAESEEAVQSVKAFFSKLERYLCTGTGKKTSKIGQAPSGQ